MQDLIQKARVLHQAYIGALPEPLEMTQQTMELREKLITEEYRETMAELTKMIWAINEFGDRDIEVKNDMLAENSARLIGELADMIVVIMGTVVALGLDSVFEQAYQMVHMRNMQKVITFDVAEEMMKENPGSYAVRIAASELVPLFVVKNAYGKVLKPSTLQPASEMYENIKQLIIKATEE